MTTPTKILSALHRRRVLTTAILAAALGWGSAAPAAPRTADGRAPAELSVVDRETGAVLPFWRQDGRPFVAGDPGHRYGLRVTNRTGGRVLLVLSVDGVNVLTGETAGYDQRGYVLDAYQSYDVNGWRKSDSEVAAFTFAALSSSYAARTGRPGDVGVIGMAVFHERAPPPPPVQDEAPWGQLRNRAAPGRAHAEPPPPLAIPSAPAPVAQVRAAPSGAASSPPVDAQTVARRPDEKLGTAHGAREGSWVTQVSFVRATSSPQAIRRIEYDTAPHLLARGVTPPYARPYPGARPPRAFPRQPGSGDFVPDPPGER